MRRVVQDSRMLFTGYQKYGNTRIYAYTYKNIYIRIYKIIYIRIYAYIGDSINNIDGVLSLWEKTLWDLIHLGTRSTGTPEYTPIHIRIYIYKNIFIGYSK